MSLRNARLCDYTWNGVNNRCPKLAVGTCCVCELDLCEEHTTLNPDGGISVSFLAESRVMNQAEHSRDLQHAVRLHLCYKCSNKIGLMRERVGETMKSFKEQMRVALRAAFAEKALAAQSPSSDSG